MERSDQGGWTPLHLAVADGQPDVVRVLVDAGADLTARTEFNRTPLHVALQLRPNSFPCCANSVPWWTPRARRTSATSSSSRCTWTTEPISATAPAGSTCCPGRRSAGPRRPPACCWTRGADCNAGALHVAAGGSRLELVRLLLDAGADVNRRDPPNGRTPLHAAVAAGPDGDTTEIVTLLLAAGADVNATTNDGASALDMGRVAAARHRRNDDGEADRPRRAWPSSSSRTAPPTRSGSEPAEDLSRPVDSALRA